MKDSLLIEYLIKRGEEAKNKVVTTFSALSAEQLNWKPTPEDWSIAQCLDHLIVSDRLYFPAFKAINEGNYKMSIWEKLNPFRNLFGKMLKLQLQETVKKKVKTPAIFAPSEKQIPTAITENYQQHLDQLVVYFSGLSNSDLDKLQITSPVSKMISYSLRYAVTILMQHEFRHINQALFVQALPEFPES